MYGGMLAAYRCPPKGGAQNLYDPDKLARGFSG